MTRESDWTVLWAHNPELPLPLFVAPHLQSASLKKSSRNTPPSSQEQVTGNTSSHKISVNYGPSEENNCLLSNFSDEIKILFRSWDVDLPTLKSLTSRSKDSYLRNKYSPLSLKTLFLLSDKICNPQIHMSVSRAASLFCPSCSCWLLVASSYVDTDVNSCFARGAKPPVVSYCQSLNAFLFGICNVGQFLHLAHMSLFIYLLWLG